MDGVFPRVFHFVVISLSKYRRRFNDQLLKSKSYCLIVLENPQCEEADCISPLYMHVRVNSHVMIITNNCQLQFVSQS